LVTIRNLNIFPHTSNNFLTPKSQYSVLFFKKNAKNRENNLKSINPNIFRESDIRGLVKTDLTPDLVENIGKAIRPYLKRQGGQVITIGRDVRNSSKKLRDIIVQGAAIWKTSALCQLRFPILLSATWELTAAL
jgi:hypothetical protein